MNAKTLVLIIVVLFVGFWLFQDPRGLAEMSGDAFWWVVDAGEATFRQLLEFIDGF